MSKPVGNHFVSNSPSTVRRPSILSDNFFYYGLLSLFLWLFVLLLVITS